MMDESNNSPFQKMIRKLASEAQEIGAGMKAAGRRYIQKAKRDDMRDDKAHKKEASGRNKKINTDDLVRERRKYPRKSCFLSVNYATDERAYQEFINDISTSGVFIETRYPLPIGQNIAITFSLPSRLENIKLTGRVARSTPQGLGIAFVLQSVDQKDYLRSHLIDM